MKVALLYQALVALGFAACVSSQKLQSNDVCRLVTFIPFDDLREPPPLEVEHQDPRLSYGYGTWPNASTMAKASYSLMAAAEMARKHFNERDSSLIKELGELGNCSITFADGPNGDGESWYFDSAHTRSLAVDQLLGLPQDEVCAVIGPVDPRASEGVSVLTEVWKVPQVAYMTIDRRLARVKDFPMFVRMIPVAEDFASKVALYLHRDVLKREYIAVIYDQSDYGE